MNKKLKARHEMLKHLSKSKSGDLHKGLGDDLKTKKLSKVTVMAKDKEGLKKGLSMAEKILAAKLGKKEDKDEEHELCPMCEGEGCSICEGESEEESSEEE